MLAVADCGTITNTHYCCWFRRASYSSLFYTFLSCFTLATFILAIQTTGTTMAQQAHLLGTVSCACWRHTFNGHNYWHNYWHNRSTPSLSCHCRLIPCTFLCTFRNETELCFLGCCSVPLHFFFFFCLFPVMHDVVLHRHADIFWYSCPHDAILWLLHSLSMLEEALFKIEKLAGHTWVNQIALPYELAAQRLPVFRRGSVCVNSRLHLCTRVSIQWFLSFCHWR